MFKLLCLFAIVVVVAGIPPRGTHWPAPGPVPVRKIEKREIPGPSHIEPNRANGNAPIRAGDDLDDMDKAETFGFGYHHYYAYPRYYYPSYYYSYYPYYGYYW
ncbi:AGAP006985-PA-like protein [Anopheles sinensis]|uniref:AGAP006985-PA-like protein n=1 Tax=Anopheles sinensis TaxID=74873 RepID=A0A084WRN7_ANOSI|nr:AGAP006985-PA-like protein [Anopheles sinensis]